MSITITVPNDDHVALRAMAKALEEIAVARGAPAKEPRESEMMYNITVDTRQPQLAAARLKECANYLSPQAEPDTTSEQVESLVGTDKRFTEEATFAEIADAAPTTDSTGTPWDERIHSASKALNSDGTWRLRRKPKDMDEAEWSQFMDSVMIEITPDDGSDDMGEVVDQSINAAHKAVAEQYGQGLANAAFTGDRTKIPESVITNTLKVGEPVEVAEGEFSQAYVFTAEPAVTPAGDDFHVDAGEVTEQDVVAIPAPPLPVPPAPQEDTESYTFPQVMKFLTERHARISSTQVEQIIREMGLTSIMDLNTQPEHTGTG